MFCLCLSEKEVTEQGSELGFNVQEFPARKMRIDEFLILRKERKRVFPWCK